MRHLLPGNAVATLLFKDLNKRLWMLNNVQIWVGGIWRRLIGQANRGGAEFERGGEERRRHGSRQREAKQIRQALFAMLKLT